MITEQQKRTAVAVVHVFECGKPVPNYGAVTVTPGDHGGLSYGACQASRSSGSLCDLVISYRSAGGRYSAELVNYVSRLSRRDPALDGDKRFRALLQEAGSDPIMHATQDRYFDARFWLPASVRARQLNLQTALGHLVLYDSTVHGSRELIVGLTEKVCHRTDVDEKLWVETYIDEREQWLASRGGLLAKTVYRTQALMHMVRANQWDLPLPLEVFGRGVTITAAHVA